MGLKNGGPTILRYIQRGLYNKDAKVYKICVDGEYMRYKGMIEDNLSKHNAEEMIASTSFEYMRTVVQNIECMMRQRAAEVLVYMDGARVANKETCRSEFLYNAEQIRGIFKALCAESDYNVQSLDYGESELQMYIQRDKTVNLNIFVTNDSDMISILYGHKPTILDDDAYTVLQDDTVSFDGTVITSKCRFYDYNNRYGPKDDVVDSCMWLNTGREFTAIGFDFIEDRLIYTPSVFRTFVAFCGTDFTNALLTESLIPGVLTAKDEDKKYLNTLSGDVNLIGALLLMLGIRDGGTIKRVDPHDKIPFSARSISDSITTYVNYITTGEMDTSIVCSRPNMSTACREYLFALREGATSFVKKELATWAQRVTLQEAAENFKTFLGTMSQCQKKGAAKEIDQFKITTTPRKRSEPVERLDSDNPFRLNLKRIKRTTPRDSYHHEYDSIYTFPDTTTTTSKPPLPSSNDIVQDIICNEIIPPRPKEPTTTAAATTTNNSIENITPPASPVLFDLNQIQQQQQPYVQLENFMLLTSSDTNVLNLV
jgi:hypothetical protein